MEALSLAGMSKSDIHVIDLTHLENSYQIQSLLQKMTGRRTVPNVFVGATSIGGGDETSAFQRNGKLVSILQKAGALKDSTDDADTEEEARTKVEKTSNITSSVSRKMEAQNIVSAGAGAVADVGGKEERGGKESCDLVSYDCFTELVQKYPILMFSLSWCPECKHSLELLDRIGIRKEQIHIIDLDDYKEISIDIRQHMGKLTGRRSVPNLFIKGEYIGGFKRTTEIHERGELVPKFQNIGALSVSTKAEPAL